VNPYHEAEGVVLPDAEIGFWETCYECGGDGFVDLYETDDPLWYEPGDLDICPICQGNGGWWVQQLDD